MKLDVIGKGQWWISAKKLEEMKHAGTSLIYNCLIVLVSYKMVTLWPQKDVSSTLVTTALWSSHKVCFKVFFSFCYGHQKGDFSCPVTTAAKVRDALFIAYTLNSFVALSEKEIPLHWLQRVRFIKPEAGPRNLHFDVVSLTILMVQRHFLKKLLLSH